MVSLLFTDLYNKHINYKQTSVTWLVDTDLIFSLSLAWDPSKPFPSCLRSNITWDQSSIFDVVLNITTADDCQSICANTESCVSFTWLSEDSPIFPFGCGLFSKTGDEFPCEHCVSGIEECPCTVKGECDSIDNNMIQVLG